MAEILTMEPNVETTTIENLSAEEQDSLQVGEQMQEAQDNLLAGKYKNAEELEKGYLELQQKLNNDEEPQQEEGEYEDEESESDAEANVLDRVWEAAISGDEFSEELTEEINNMAPTDIANMYLDYRQQAENGTAQGRDFSQADVQQLKGVVGGEENYTCLLYTSPSPRD